ncbi:MAG: DNA repair protein RecO [Christensenellaceae bacterium]|jgi:DNA repair protein RecO (recombination protein O)|nr:DNA repair protein RecO [Christensenellaceae bacterium]
MASVTVCGIVLRYANYKDYDRILTLFTRERGVVSASARGCRRPGSKLLGASELFIYGEFVLFESRGKYTVDSCDVRERFYPLRENIDKFTAATYFLSLAGSASAKEQKATALFTLLYYALSFLAYGEQAPLDIALCFTARCLHALGYSPALTHCVRCGQDLRGLPRMGFDPAAGGAVCGACLCQGDLPVTPLSLEAVRRMLLLRDEDMNKVVLPQQVRQELQRALGDYAEYVLERKFAALRQIGEP